MRGLVSNGLLAVAAVAGFLALQAALDLMERTWEDRRAYRTWLAQACMPVTERQVTTLRIQADGKLHCSTVDNAAYGHGRRLVTASVSEVAE